MNYNINNPYLSIAKCKACDKCALYFARPRYIVDYTEIDDFETINKGGRK